MERLRAVLLTWGLPGLFVIAFLDSAGVPLPGGVEVVVMLLAWQRPSLFPLIALLAAVGSTLGCFVLYQVGSKSGELALARFSTSSRERVAQKIRDNDLLSVTIAMLGPPPFPTKLVVLMAGFVRMKPVRFLAAVFVGRLIRFGAEAYLAVRFGERAAVVLREHYASIGFGLAVVFGLGLVVRYLMTASRGSRDDKAPVEGSEEHRTS